MTRPSRSAFRLSNLTTLTVLAGLVLIVGGLVAYWIYAIVPSFQASERTKAEILMAHLVTGRLQDALTNGGPAGVDETLDQLCVLKDPDTGGVLIDWIEVSLLDGSSDSRGEFSPSHPTSSSPLYSLATNELLGEVHLQYCNMFYRRLIADARHKLYWLVALAVAALVLLHRVQLRLLQPLSTIADSVAGIDFERPAELPTIPSRIREAREIDVAIRDLLARLETTRRAEKEAAGEIARKLEEREVLMREIHHRVKNNLQIVSSLLSLQAKTVGDDGGVRQVLAESQGRLRAMALIHESLYRSGDLAQIDFSAYLRHLTGMLRTSFVDPGREIAIELDVDGVALGLDTAIPCGLIVNELVTNALKYAFGDRRQGTIRVALRAENGDGRYRLSVEDDGVGITDEAASENAGTLGLRLVRSLAGQLQGEISVSRAPGTRFEVSFPR